MPDFSAFNITVYRGDRCVLRDLALAVPGGHCLQVTGPNGAGKTTLIRTLCGLVEADSLDLTLAGQPCSSRDPAFQSALAYLGHDAPLKGDLSALENLRFGVGLRRRVNDGDLARALERVGAGTWTDRPVRSLSAGQRRRVALAALWLSGAALWFLDEPATNLDARGQALVASLLEEHLDHGGSAVAATHQDLGITGSRLLSLVLGARS